MLMIYNIDLKNMLIEVIKVASIFMQKPLFFKYSEAPVTVLAVKDRVLAHNPLGTLYLSDGYFKNKV